MYETFGTHVTDLHPFFWWQDLTKSCLEYSNADKRIIFKFTFKKQGKEEVV